MSGTSPKKPPKLPCFIFFLSILSAALIAQFRPQSICLLHILSSLISLTTALYSAPEKQGSTCCIRSLSLAQSCACGRRTNPSWMNSLLLWAPPRPPPRGCPAGPAPSGSGAAVPPRGFWRAPDWRGSPTWRKGEGPGRKPGRPASRGSRVQHPNPVPASLSA